MARAAGAVPGWLRHRGGVVSRLIRAGDTAPDFTAAASDGETYRLRDLLTGSRVFLVFYPGNDTPG